MIGCIMEEISQKVLHFGQFKEVLEKIVDLLRSEYPSSVIIRGNPGSGKKTLIEEAIKITQVKCVSVSPEQYSDDYIAIKSIAEELGYAVRGTVISDILREIRNKTNSDEKLVIVLEDFEDLCTQRQSLLYNLMNLIHTNPTKIDKGPNLTLIGLTCNLEWAENLEKRVRSRLNAKCIDMGLPYRSVEEYIHFTRELIGGNKYQLSGDFVEQLEYMYWFTNRSIRGLKKYLLKICEPNGRGAYEVRFDKDDYKEDYQVLPNNFLRERLRHLTRDQLDLLKYALGYCSINQSLCFTLEAVALRYNLDLRDGRMLRDLALLAKLRLIKPDKLEQAVGVGSVFYAGMAAHQFSMVMRGDTSLHCAKTDYIWKQLK